MCRWFAYISPSEPCLLSDVLITPPHGITKQVSSHYLPYLTDHALDQDLVDDQAKPPSLTPPSRPPSAEDRAAHDLKLRNLALNADGGGIAVYTPSFSCFTAPSAQPVLYPAVFKSIQPLSHDDNFLSLAAHTETLCVLAHVRAGSGAPVSTLNCHPFVFGRWSVMHNGAVGKCDEVRRELLSGLSKDVYAAVKGGTDSEVLACLIVDGLTGGQGKEAWEEERSVEEVFKAVEECFRLVAETQRRAGAVAPSSLNVCVTDGRRMVTTRYRDAEEEQPPSLYWSTKAGVTLNRKFPGHPDQKIHEQLKGTATDVVAREHGAHVIVASEPSTFKEEEWALLDKNTALLVDVDGKTNVKKMGPY